MIRSLYELGTQGLSDGSGPLSLNENWADKLSLDSKMPLSPRAEDTSADKTSGDLANQSTEASSCFYAEGYGQPSVTNRRRKSHEEDDAISYMYFCCPSSKGRCLSEMTIRTKDDRLTDAALIEKLKIEYCSLRPFPLRLRNLRGFSRIRLARVSTIDASLRDADTDLF